MYFLGIGLILSILGTQAQAQPRRFDDLRPTSLTCSIRDGKLLTILGFRTEIVTDHPEVVGELANFLIQADGTRKYISGLLFGKLLYTNNRISGDTGDPSDIVGRFTLTRLDAHYHGRWAYWFQRSETDVVRAIFNCAYSNGPSEFNPRRRPRPRPN